MARRLMAAALGVAGLLAASGAGAQEVFGGVAAHDIDLGVTACCSESGADIQFGVRSEPFARGWGWELRGYLMGSVNTDDGLNDGAAGVLARHSLGSRGYVQAGLGAAVTDGSNLKFQASADELYLGSRVLAQPEIAVGWRFTDRWALEAAYTHLSHAQIAGDQNPGTDALALRLTYQLGHF